MLNFRMTGKAFYVYTFAFVPRPWFCWQTLALPLARAAASPTERRDFREIFFNFICIITVIYIFRCDIRRDKTILKVHFILRPNFFALGAIVRSVPWQTNNHFMIKFQTIQSIFKTKHRPISNLATTLVRFDFLWVEWYTTLTSRSVTTGTSGGLCLHSSFDLWRHR